MITTTTNKKNDQSSTESFDSSSEMSNLEKRIEQTTLDLFTTPPASPVKPAETPSPVTAVLKMLKEESPGHSMDAKGNKTLGKLEKALEKPNAQRSQRSLMASFNAHIVPQVQGSMTTSTTTTSRTLIGVADIEDKFVGGWVEKLLQVLQRKGLSIHVVNTGHLTAPQINKNSTSGFHFCPPGHENEKYISKKHQSPFSDVWFAEFDAGQGNKSSTFFPSYITDEAHLLTILADGTKIAMTDNRAIFETQTVTPFRYEVCFAGEGLYMTTAYPIYYFAKYNEQATIHLTQEIKISMKDVLEQLKNLSRDVLQQHYRYTVKNTDGSSSFIVDISKLLSHSPINRGVYLEFLSSELPLTDPTSNPKRSIKESAKKNH